MTEIDIKDPITTIAIRTSTREQLKLFGTKDATYDDILISLMGAAKKNKKV